MGYRAIAGGKGWGGAAPKRGPVVMEPGAIVSGISAIVALVAAAISWSSSRHAKRNADKALGDLPPFIEVFQTEESIHGDRLPAIAVQITNYNRRAILLRRLDVEVDDRYTAFRTTRDDETDVDKLALAGIVASNMDREYSHFVYNPPLRLPGNRLLGTTPPRYDFQFCVTVRESEFLGAWPAPAHVNIEYSVAGAEHVFQCQFDITLHRWSPGTFKSRFRVLPKSPDDNA